MLQNQNQNRKRGNPDLNNLESLNLKRHELTEDEQKKTDELASEFSTCLEMKKSEDIWKGFGSESAF